MANELFFALKSLENKKLEENELDELLIFFQVCTASILRNQLAIIFGDNNYPRAVPVIISKIFDPSLENNNGSLVYALGLFDLSDYYLDIISMVGAGSCETRLCAFDIISECIQKIPFSVRQDGIHRLMEYHKRFSELAESNETQSRLHFIDATISLLGVHVE